jgi:hypothetical protein
MILTIKHEIYNVISCNLFRNIILELLTFKYAVYFMKLALLGKKLLCAKHNIFDNKKGKFMATKCVITKY